MQSETVWQSVMNSSTWGCGRWICGCRQKR